MVRVLTHFFFYLFLSSFLVSSPAPLRAAEAPTNNVISMPWDAFMQLWLSARQEEAPEPKPAYGKILYLAEAEKAEDQYLVRVTAKMGLSLFGAGETLIPLFPDELVLESLEVDGKETPWTVKDGYDSAFISGAGEHQIEATFTLKAETSGSTRKLKLPFLGQARQEIVLLVPEKNIQSYVDYGVALETIEMDEGSQIHAYFKAMSELTLIWYEKGASVATNQRPRSQSELITYWRVGDEGIESRMQAHFDIIEGWMEGFSLFIPEGLIIDEVKWGQENLRWVTQKAPEPGLRKLLVVFPSVMTGSQDVTLTGWIPESGPEYGLPLPRIEEAQKNRVYIGIAEGKMVDFQAQDLNQIPADESPDGAGKNGPWKQAYEMAGGNPQLIVRIQSQGGAKAFEIKSAEIITTLHAGILTKAMLKVNNLKAQFLPVGLSKDIRLLEARVNGVRTPVMQSSPYLVPLPAKAVSEVELVYEQLSDLPQGLGFVTYALADFGMPAESQVWHVGSRGNFFVGSSAGKRLPGIRPALVQELKEGTWKSFEMKTPAPATLSLLFVGPKATRAIVFLASILLALYMFWALTFFFERAYLPESLYETRSFILGTLCALLLAFVLAFFNPMDLVALIYSLAVSLTLFALWQNRLVANRFRVLFQNRYRPWPVLLLLVFLGVSLWALATRAAVWALMPPILMIGLHMAFLKTYPRLVEKRARAKVLPHLLLALSLSVSAPLQAQENIELKTGDELKEGHVYMEWSLIEDLLHKIEGKEKEKQKTAGLKYVFGSAKVTGDVAEGFAQIRIETPVEILSEQWVLVPVVHEGQIVTEVSLDGEMVPLRREGNMVFLQGIKGKGQVAKLEVELLLPLEAGSFRTESDLLKGATVTLSFEGDLRNAVLNRTVWQKREASVIKAALDSSGVFELKMGDSSLPVPHVMPAASSRVVRTQTVARVGKSQLDMLSTLFIHAGGESLESLHVGLPEGVELKRIEGDQVRIWVKERDGYKIDFKTPVTSTTEMILVYQKSLDFNAGDIDIPSLRIEGLPHEGHLAVVLDALSELHVTSLKGLRKVAQVPMTLDKAPVYSFRFPENDYELKLSRGEVRAELKATPSIENASIRILAQDTSWKGIADLEGFEGAPTLGFSIPKGFRLTKSLVNGQPVKASLGDAGGLALNLPDNPREIHLEYEGAAPRGSAMPLPLPSFAARIAAPVISLELKRGVSLLPLKGHWGETPAEFLKMLGITGQLSDQTLIRYEGPWMPGARVPSLFLKGNCVLIVGLVLLFFVGLAALAFWLPGLFAQGRYKLGGGLILLAVFFLLVSPFPWFYLVAALGTGLFIRLLWRRLKDDNAIIV